MEILLKVFKALKDLHFDRFVVVKTLLNKIA